MAKEARPVNNRILNALEVYDTEDLKGFIGGMTVMIGTVIALFISTVMVD